MRGNVCLITTVLACGAQVTCVPILHAGPPGTPRLTAATATLGSASVTPGTISFSANNPDAGAVFGSAPANVTWMLLSGSQTQNWTLTVQAGATSFIGCPTIPLSAVRVTCNSATVSGGSGNGVCNGSFPLSTTPQQVAGGAEGDGSNAYSVSL